MTIILQKVSPYDKMVKYLNFYTIMSIGNVTIYG